MDLNNVSEYQYTISNNNKSETMLEEDHSGFWAVLDFLNLCYYVTFLFMIMKKHYHNLEPVHILTMMPLVDIALALLNFLIFDMISLMEPECHKDFFIFVFGMLALSFHLDVLSGEVNGFVFVSFDVYYHEYITNIVAIMTLVINKVIGVIGAVVVTLTVSNAATCNLICITFFSSEAFYLGAIPSLVCFSLIIPIMFYMSYTKYSISKLQPTQHNLTNHQQVQATQHQVPRILNNTLRRQSVRPAPLSSSPPLPHSESQGQGAPASNKRLHSSTAICPHPSSSSSSIPSISGEHHDQGQERIPPPRLAWQDPSLWLPSTSYLPPAVSTFFEEVKKYVKFNIYNVILLSLHLPINVMTLITKFGNLTCEEWGPFAEGLGIFQTIFFVIYPYFVKLKLDRFKRNL